MVDRSPWGLDPEWTFLNHGSFGAAPLPILAEQRRWQDELERQPVQFMLNNAVPALDEARKALAIFVGCDPKHLAFVSNATEGINTVLRSLPWTTKDHIVITDHSYGACTRTAEYVAGRYGAQLTPITLDLPLTSEDDVVKAVIDGLPPSTTFLMIDHISSVPGLILPIEQIVPLLEKKGIRVLVDGAHAPGQIDLDLDDLGASYYVGNAHKWMCTPKGTAMLHVRPDRQSEITPLAISHGWQEDRGVEDAFDQAMTWTGTRDPSPWLVIPFAIEFMAGLHPQGWDGLRQSNTKQARKYRDRLHELLGTTPLAPRSMVGHLAAVELPESWKERWEYVSSTGLAMPTVHPLQVMLAEKYRIETNVQTLGKRTLLRASMQHYVTEDDLDHLYDVLASFIDG